MISIPTCRTLLRGCPDVVHKARHAADPATYFAMRGMTNVAACLEANPWLLDEVLQPRMGADSGVVPGQVDDSSRSRGSWMIALAMAGVTGALIYFASKGERT
jgi:hypothetical protein